ncbi:phage tail assembly protein [Chromobacterium violaceum]|uniref:Phage tail assembly protein n=1 Tax=Chromobacterium violaceum TaxID=536 RepID=A0A202B2C2_CHRVL|nr:phage tail assembly protein [Chromobacterium violaceum]OVE45586.1 hypothetical protein CBW21_22365 [Chromobacterium violaceum]
MSEISKEEVADELTLTLRKPIDFGGEQIHVLELREPTLDELEKFSKEYQKNGHIAGSKFLISLVSGHPAAAIGRIGARDYKAAEEYLANFV